MRLPVVPIGKPRMTQRDRWAKRPAVVRYHAYCDLLREEWRQLTKLEVPENLFIIFTIPMPISWSKKKKVEMNGKPHQQRPDIDNLCKAFMDALCDDDSYIHELHAYKVWGEEGSIQVSLETDKKSC